MDPSVFEPVRHHHVPQPLEILQEDAPPRRERRAPCEAAAGGDVGDIFVYRATRHVTVYRIESHGRRYYRTLEYTSNVKFTLGALQPGFNSRDAPWPSWERHGAGHPYACSNTEQASAVITREWSVSKNLSGGRETYIPTRLLHGVLASAFLDDYQFWQAEDDTLRGYATAHKASTAAFVIHVQLLPGNHVVFAGKRFAEMAVDKELHVPPAVAIVRRLEEAPPGRGDSGACGALGARGVLHEPRAARRPV